MIKRITGLLLSLCVSAMAFPLLAAEPGSRMDTRQIIVRLKDDGVRRIQSVRRDDVVPDLRLPDGSQLTFIRRFDGNGMVVRLPQSVTYRQAEQLAAQLAADPAVLAAQADKRLYPALVPFDPEYLPAPGADPLVDSGQWNLFEAEAGIHMPTAWDQNTGSANVVIAQLDTGILTHRDLNAARVLAGYDFITDIFTANDGDARDPDPSDPGDATLDNDWVPVNSAPTVPGTAFRWPASWSPSRTTALIWPVSIFPHACYRCACWANAGAVSRT